MDLGKIHNEAAIKGNMIAVVTRAVWETKGILALIVIRRWLGVAESLWKGYVPSRIKD